MSQLAFERSGTGAPLVLLHGIGMSGRVWDPVVPALSAQFEVIAIDLPGHGRSAPFPDDVEPLPATMAVSVAKLLDDLGIIDPYVVGNSLGGWVALELARIRSVASLMLLSPAGLWRDSAPRYAQLSLRASSWLARHAGGLLAQLVNYRLGRLLVLGQTHGRPTRLTAEQARATILTLATSSGFDATLSATANQRYRGGPAIDAPVTVAFGSRDLVLLARQARHLDRLPSQTRVAELPGCGHVPMSDDPTAVIDLIRSAIPFEAPGEGHLAGASG
ncbi:alpha/beta fold hydrolase [Jatrophihabitans sp. DSM 45814]